MRSPIITLFNAIASSPYRIAPERAAELQKFDVLNPMELKFTDDVGFTFGVKVKENVISTNVVTLEYLWASIHAHLVFYDEYTNAQREGVEYFDSGKIERCRVALDLAKWAATNIKNNKKVQWPKNQPKPEQYPEPNSDIHVANEAFLCATAWIIHHEIAHVRLDHQPFVSVLSVQEEKDADISATRWILEKCTDKDEVTKRVLGIAAAILSIQSIEESGDFDIFETHPRAFVRIDYILNQTAIEQNDLIYAFAAIIFQMQLTYKGVSVAHEGESFRDMLSEYLIEYARTNRS